MTTRKINWDALQLGDILLTTSTAAISRLIRAGEEWREEFIHRGDAVDGIEDAVEAVWDNTIPSHSLFVYEPRERRGAEMTYPKARYCDLRDYDRADTYIVGSFRCPWLNDKHNPDAAKYLRDRLRGWIDDFIDKGTRYGIENLFAFVAPIPEDKDHPVCSMFTTLGLIKSLYCEGYPLKFPDEWIIAGSDSSPTVGLVSPKDQMQVFNALGWGLPLF